MHEFLDGFVNAYLDNFERFRFFVLADSFYNYHRQYDLSDTVIRQYDTDTKKHGEFVISCFNSNISPDMFEKTKVGISMIIGFLRRYALIPQNSWPRTEEEKISMINNFKDLVNVVFQNIGFDLESHMIFPENHVP
ncbi:MAG: hypothetical protein HQ557_03620 [Bacteroidetes bacterium]|nr:hypothetical protein [Bacteroidota bacterium]